MYGFWYEPVVAIKMRKVKIDKNLFFFYPVSYLLEASLDCETDNLIDETGKILHSIDEKEAVFSDEKYFYAFPLDYESLNNFCGNSINPKKKYWEESKNILSFGIYDANKDLYKVVTTQKSEIKEALPDSYFNHLAAFFNEENRGVIQIDFESFLALEKDLKEKKYDKIEKSVEEIKRVFDIKQTNNKKEKEEKKISPFEIKQYLDQRVVLQEEAKKGVISVVMMNDQAKTPSQRLHAILIGPTGTGKTLLLRSLSECLDKPMVIVDTTKLVTQGYMGGHLETDCLEALLQKTNGDLKKAEQGIVVFDEFDKKGMTSEQDLYGKGVYHSMLSFMDGNSYPVIYQNALYSFDTSHLTIFATGTFQQVFDAKKKEEKIIGFGSKEESKSFPTEEDFIEFGNVPRETMGRFSSLLFLEPHTKESLMDLLLHSKESYLLFLKDFFKAMSVEFTWEEEYLQELCKKTLKCNLGARKLKGFIEESVKQARWEILKNPETYNMLCLTKESLRDPSKYILTTKKAKTLQLERKM